MKIGLIAVDSQYPNLALMKIARYWRQEGAIVEWWTLFSTTFNDFSPRKNFTCREYNKLLN